MGASVMVAPYRRPKKAGSRLMCRGQGNRISDLGEDFGEERVLPSCPLDLDAQGAFGGLLADEIEGHVAEDGEVVGTVIQAVSGIVFVHDDVEAPVQAVLDRPVRAGGVAEALGRQRRA